MDFSPDRASLEALVPLLAGSDAVICCAGNPDASSTNRLELFAANAAVPALVGRACVEAGVQRFLHVSSAVVQGRLPVLDSSSQTDLFSDYSRSKAAGEAAAIKFGPAETVIYRPPSVHAPSRRVSRGISRIASSPLASVAAPGTGSTPQTLVENVASAITFLATTPLTPPQIVHHPSEGLTTVSLMELLGGKKPRIVPLPIATAIVRLLNTAGRVAAPLAPHARRVEMLWFGQPQSGSWLTDAGWTPPLGADSWRALGETIRREKKKA